mmetsp:Transcript_4050/g.8535  ORF Transcript_4050/g.8535 Transcript_4050/m.8535 type:complete len:375 (+) Transcript_4050:74-1198(+)
MTAKGLPPSAHAISGAVGGAFATWLFYPLELLRVEMQKTPPPSSQEDDENIKHDNEPPETNLECFIRLYKKQALYRGASAMVTTMLISSYITFFALESIRRSMATLKQGGQQSNRQQHTRQIHQLQNHIKFLNYILPKSKMGSSLLASTITGVINVFLTTPLWNGTRRIMESDPQPSKPISSCINDEKKQVNISVLPLKSEPNLWEMMYQIAKDGGVLQLWHGTVSSLLLVSNPAIQYFLYEQIRVWILVIKIRRRGSGGAGESMQLTAMEAFVFGALSKTVATVITYPLQLGQVLVRLRKNEVKDLEQADPCMEIKEYNGMADCLYQQYTRGGFSLLFQGMSSKLVQTVGQASFIFVTYEQMLALVAKVIESR